MIQLLNFIDTGFIITLGLLILLCGGIMLYNYRRLNILENSIIEHGKILQNFIINYNNQLLNKDATTMKKNLNQSLDNYENTNNKINVSDDENDSDSDSDSDNDTDNENDNDTDNDETDDDIDEDDDTDNDNDNNNDNNSDDNRNQLDKLIISNKIENKDLININNDILVDDDEEFNLTANSKIINLQNNDTNIDDENDDKENTLTNPKKNINKMKVDELRTLVVTNNLTDNNTANTLKKSDLIKLLQ